MSLVVRFVGPICQIADGIEEVEVEGETVAEALRALCDKYPNFEAHFMKNGYLGSNVRMTVNDELIQFLDDGVETRVSKNDELVLLSAMAGG